MATKTLSIRMNEEYYRTLRTIAKEEKGDISTTVRELVELGRVMLAMKKYKNSGASLEKAARIAGVCVMEMIDILKEHDVEANLEYEDYLDSLQSLKKVW